MKIKDHKAETLVLIERFEKSEEPHNLLQLFDTIDLRLLDEQIWEQYGLNDEDDVPDAPTKLMVPKFT